MTVEDPMNPEAWFQTPGVCGSCLAWRPIEPGAEDSVAPGKCLLRSELSQVPASLRKCSKYQQRGEFKLASVPKTTRSKRRKASPVVVKRLNAEGELIDVTPPSKSRPSRPSGSSGSNRPAEPYQPSSPPPYRPFPNRDAPSTVDVGSLSSPLVKAGLVDVCRNEIRGRPRDMHSKYRNGGRVRTEAEGIQKTVSAENFFAKLEQLAKCIDALEEAVETHNKLDDSDDLLSYIQKIRGSFTTFNLMFSAKEDYFSGKL